MMPRQVDALREAVQLVSKAASAAAQAADAAASASSAAANSATSADTAASAALAALTKAQHSGLANPELWVAIGTVGLVFVTGILAFYTYQLWSDARETAKRQAEQTRAALELNRAILLRNTARGSRSTSR